MFKTVRYSEKGTNECIKEEETFVFFMNYLEDCEKGFLSNHDLNSEWFS